MQWVVKKPSRALTALRSRTDSSSTPAIASAAACRVGLVAGTRGDQHAEFGAVRLHAVAGQRVGEGVGEHVAVGGDHERGGAGRPRVGLAGNRRAAAAGVQGGDGGGQRGPGRGLRGERAGYGGGVEPRVGQGQPQGVPVADEAAVDDGDPLGGGRRGQPGRDGAGRVGLDHLESQRPQVVRERRRRPGGGRAGENSGRQRNPLPGSVRRRARGAAGETAGPGRADREVIGWRSESSSLPVRLNVARPV